jgi:hypothetical protein
MLFAVVFCGREGFGFVFCKVGWWCGGVWEVGRGDGDEGEGKFEAVSVGVEGILPPRVGAGQG